MSNDVCIGSAAAVRSEQADGTACGRRSRCVRRIDLAAQLPPASYLLGSSL